MKLLEAFTTVGSEADALRLAELAVQQGLAACVQMVPVKRVYRWQGRLQHDAEIQLGFKTPDAGGATLWRLAPGLRPLLTPALDSATSLSREIELSYPEPRAVRLYLVPFAASSGEVSAACAAAAAGPGNRAVRCDRRSGSRCS